MSLWVENKDLEWKGTFRSLTFMFRKQTMSIPLWKTLCHFLRCMKGKSDWNWRLGAELWWRSTTQGWAKHSSHHQPHVTQQSSGFTQPRHIPVLLGWLWQLPCAHPASTHLIHVLGGRKPPPPLSLSFASPQIQNRRTTGQVCNKREVKCSKIPQELCSFWNRMGLGWGALEGKWI